MLLIVDVALVALIVSALCVASWRGRRRARAARASDLADLIPGRVIPGRVIPGRVIPGRVIPGRVAGGPAPAARAPRPAPAIVESHATWSAASERGETAPPEPELPEPELPEPVLPEPVSGTNGVSRAERPAVVVVPRGPSWVVRRDGASRVSSVHSSRDVAVARGHKTARRERVVLEVRDEDESLVDRIDYSAGRSATA